MNALTVLTKIVSNHGVEVRQGTNDVQYATFGNRLSVEVNDDEAQFLRDLDAEVN